jgi:DNA-binding transcriptional MerR regulator
MSARSYLSIGDVLTLLRQEFPDVTISKIRFLESQGLVNPERTPSGYRKFYDHDVERLRWVLRQQREHFLPLKVIKDRLDGESSDSPSEEAPPAAEGEATATTAVGGAPSTATSEPDAGQPSAAHPTPSPSSADQPTPVDHQADAGDAPVATSDQEDSASEDEGPTLPGIEPVLAIGAKRSGARTAGEKKADQNAGGADAPPATSPPALTLVADPPPESEAPPTAPRTVEPPAASTTDREGPAAPAPSQPAAASPPKRSRPSPAAKPSATPEPAPTHSNGLIGGVAASAPKGPRASSAVDLNGASLSLDELSSASGLDVPALRELQEYGLLHSKSVAGVENFDEEALAVSVVAARFAAFGIEPRHLRLYKNAADREAGFVEQIVTPLVRQRNPEARARATETAEELAQLGQQLRGSLLRSALSDLLNS